MSHPTPMQCPNCNSQRRLVAARRPNDPTPYVCKGCGTRFGKPKPTEEQPLVRCWRCGRKVRPRRDGALPKHNVPGWTATWPDDPACDAAGTPATPTGA